MIMTTAIRDGGVESVMADEREFSTRHPKHRHSNKQRSDYVELTFLRSRPAVFQMLHPFGIVQSASWQHCGGLDLDEVVGSGEPGNERRRYSRRVPELAGLRHPRAEAGAQVRVVAQE